MVENQRRHHTLSPWSAFTEHLLGGAPVPTLSGGEARVAGATHPAPPRARRSASLPQDQAQH